MKIFLFIVVIQVFVHQGFALRCPTCQGVACDDPFIQEIECNRRIPNIRYSEKDIFGDADYGCLDLEYETEDNKNMKLKHCVLWYKDIDHCVALSSKFNVKKCYVTNDKLGKLNGPNKGESSSKPATKSPKETTPHGPSTKASTTTSTEASKTTSTEASKTTSTEASKTTSTEASKTTSTEAPKTTSTGASKTTSSEASTRTSTQPSSTTKKPNAAVSSWNFSVISLTLAITAIILFQ